MSLITGYIERIYTAGPIYLVTKWLTEDITRTEMTTPLDNGIIEDNSKPAPKDLELEPKWGENILLPSWYLVYLGQHEVKT